MKCSLSLLFLLVLLSQNAFAGAIDFANSCTLSIRGPDYKVILNSGSKDDFIMWLKGVDLYMAERKTLKGDYTSLYERIDASHHRSDLKKIVAWQKERFSKLDINVVDPKILDRTPKPSEKTTAFWKWYVGKAKLIQKETAALLNKRSLSLKEYITAARNHSMIYDGFVIQSYFWSYSAAEEFENAFEKMLAEDLGKHFKSPPVFVNVPTTAALGFHDINVNAGIGMKYSGTIGETAMADSSEMEALPFEDHDYSHNGGQFGQSLKSFAGKHIFNRAEAVENMSDEELLKFIKMMVEQNANYGFFYSVIKDYPHRDQVIAESMFFNLDHEHTSPLLEKQNIFDQMEYLMTTYPERVYKIESLVDRWQHDLDFGAAFDKSEPKVTTEELQRVFKRVIHDGKLAQKKRNT